MKRCPRCGSPALGTSPQRGHDCVNVLIDRVGRLERLLLEAHQLLDREATLHNRGDRRGRVRALGLAS